MEQKIRTSNGIEYILKSDNYLNQKQIENVISQLSVKTLSKTCITAATVGQTLSLQNTIQSGTSPYNVSIKKDGTPIQTWTATSTLTQSINYQLQPSDIGTKRFSVDVTDSCPTGAKSTTEFCDIVVSPAVTADTTPPSIPTNLKDTKISATQFNLTWDASVDPIVTGQVTSGMKEYKIYRNGVLWTTSIQTTVTVTVSTTTQYSISAVDNANNESVQCSPITLPPPTTCTLDVGSFVSYDGNNQWQYSFSFPAKGTEHITLRTWFDRQGAPFGLDYTIYRCESGTCSTNGGNDYLDSVDLNANYRIFLNTDKGWTSTYSCTPTPSYANWVISKGGATGLKNNLSALGEIIDGYLYVPNTLGFTVTLGNVGTTINYYLGV